MRMRILGIAALVACFLAVLAGRACAQAAAKPQQPQMVTKTYNVRDLVTPLRDLTPPPTPHGTARENAPEASREEMLGDLIEQLFGEAGLAAGRRPA